MFSIDPAFTHVAVPGTGVLFLGQSINVLAVKVPGTPVEPATAYLASFTPRDGFAAVVIYLHYGESNRFVAYVNEPKTFPRGEHDRVLDEARDFLESMGFMMDDASFAAQTPERQVELMARAPLFHANLAAFAKGRELDQASDAEFVPEAEVEPINAPVAPAVPSPRAQAAGRMLMSF